MRSKNGSKTDRRRIDPKVHEQSINDALAEFELSLDSETYKRLLNFTYRARIETDEPVLWLFVLLGYYSTLVATAPKAIAKAEKSISQSVQKLEKIQAVVGENAGDGLMYAVYSGCFAAVIGCAFGVMLTFQFYNPKPSDEAVLREARRVILMNCEIEFASGEDCYLPNPNKGESEVSDSP